MSAIFYQIFIFHQMIALQKLWKTFFIPSKKLSRYSDFCILSSPLFFPVSHCFRGWLKKHLLRRHQLSKLELNNIMFDILRKKLGVTLKLCLLNIFMEKSCRKCSPKASPRPRFKFAKKPKTAVAYKKFFLK